MMIKKIILIPVLIAVAYLTGCASADRQPLVKTQTSARPADPAERGASPGSLFPAAQITMTGAYRPLFEDRRARYIGDTLTVLLNETTSASKNSGATAKRKNDIAGSFGLSNIGPGSNTYNNKGTLALGGNVQQDGSGTSTASNAFNGFITVTVLEVLSNGNLSVAGEKQVAVGFEEEIIRFGGIVNPNNLVNNTVSSLQVADARIEYRGKGVTDDVREPGWLTRLFLKASPF
jgi:flagellar L-ring protein precursor FlgH